MSLEEQPFYQDEMKKLMLCKGLDPFNKIKKGSIGIVQLSNGTHISVKLVFDRYYPFKNNKLKDYVTISEIKGCNFCIRMNVDCDTFEIYKGTDIDDVMQLKPIIMTREEFTSHIFFSPVTFLVDLSSF